MKRADYYTLEQTIRSLLGFEIGVVRVRHFVMPGGADVLLVRDPELASSGRVFVALEAGRFPMLEGSNVDALDMLRAYAAVNRPAQAMQGDASTDPYHKGAVAYREDKPDQRREFATYAAAIRALEDEAREADADETAERVGVFGPSSYGYRVGLRRVEYIIEPKR